MVFETVDWILIVQKYQENYAAVAYVDSQTHLNNHRLDFSHQDLSQQFFLLENEFQS